MLNDTAFIDIRRAHFTETLAAFDKVAIVADRFLGRIAADFLH
jgi:hypothetical protein